MAQCMHFMKTGCNGKISQVSGFQNHLQTKSNLHILSVRTDSKNPVCHDGPCTAGLQQCSGRVYAKLDVFVLFCPKNRRHFSLEISKIWLHCIKIIQPIPLICHLQPKKPQNNLHLNTESYLHPLKVQNILIPALVYVHCAIWCCVLFLSGNTHT